MHLNDLLLEPLKKLSYKTNFAKKKKWFDANEVVLTPGIDPYQLIIESIKSPTPLMVARYGSTELTCVLAYIFSNSDLSYFKKVIDYMKGEIPAFWFGYKNRNEICSNSGFFQNDKKLIIRFCKMMQEDIKELDILLSWINAEKYASPFLPAACKKISLWDIQPWFQETPWTMSLEGKKVLIIHPYAETIEKQYQNRKNIFPNKQILPDMDLKTLKAVQTIRNNKAPFETWFHALDYMKTAIEKIDFDIALIGAGAYGLPLAAHIKRKGKQSIHIGGSLQLYFGIIGSRWEQDPNFKALFNEHWVRPSPEEHPKDYKKGEGAVYW